MSAPVLSRGALARVLQSLLSAELKAIQGPFGKGDSRPQRSAGSWPEGLRMASADVEALGCDSLDLLRLGAATNEMFHLFEGAHAMDLLSVETFGGWLDLIEENWRWGVSRVTFLSSGSTGLPKRCTHEVSFLITEIDYLAGLFQNTRRIISFVGSHHIYGFLFTAMLSDRLGVQVVQGSGAGEGGKAGGLRCGDLVVAVPEQWQWLDRSVPAWPEGVSGVVSTAPCPAGLVASLTGRGLSGMTEVYGSSETSGVAVRIWADETYRLMPQWKLRTGVNPETSVLTHSSGRQMEIMDYIIARGAGRFVLDGRRDAAVQVGGTNVYPDRIAASLRGLRGVADAAVRKMRPAEGTRLKAFVVPDAGNPADSLAPEVESWILRNLTVAERPTAVLYGDSVPRNELGKAIDW